MIRREALNRIDIPDHSVESMRHLRNTTLLAASILAAVTLTASADSASLAGSQWGYPLDAGEEDPRFVRFSGDGKLFGNGGCNNFRGKYHQAANSITIGPLATTRKACPEDIMAGERNFLSALTSARGARTTHFKLVLLDADGTELLRLVRQDWD